MIPLPNYGDLIPVDQFINACQSGFVFIDYDGYGYPATETECDHSVTLWPSKVKDGVPIVPAWATHVIWFNR